MNFTLSRKYISKNATSDIGFTGNKKQEKLAAGFFWLLHLQEKYLPRKFGFAWIIMIFVRL